MNDDPIPSSAARQELHSGDDEQDTTGRDRDGGGGRVEDSNDENGNSSAVRAEVARKTKLRRAALSKKMQFMSHLMKSLDMVFCAEICTLYYMECSLARLLLRMFPHLLFLSPKSDSFFMHMSAQRPHVVAVLVPNFVCALLHLAWSLPHADEVTRGYLHGGVIIDFVGQAAPSSRLGLLALDLVILAVQCLMLAVHQEREALRKVLSGGREAGSSSGGEAAGPAAAAAAAAVGTTQDLDAEERGVLRERVQLATDETNEIEMRPLNRRPRGRIHGADNEGDGGGEGVDDGEREDDALAYSRRPAAPEMWDALISGNAVLGEFHVIGTLRTAGSGYQDGTAYSLQSLGYHATWAAVAAESRARMAQRRQP